MTGSIDNAVTPRAGRCASACRLPVTGGIAAVNLQVRDVDLVDIVVSLDSGDASGSDAAAEEGEIPAGTGCVK